MTLESNADALGLLAMLALVVIATAPMSPGAFIRWLLEEWRVFKLDTWDDGKYDAPRAGSITDPRVARMVERQRIAGDVLRQNGLSILCPRRYIPDGTKPAEPPPGRRVDADVIPIQRAGGKR